MLLDYALQLAGRGWRVFPCHSTISGSCSCGKPCGKLAGKHPRIRKWQEAATTDAEQIVKWWTRWPDANIAIATGAELVVIDMDGQIEIAKMVALAAPHGGLPDTLTAATARGFHLYFAGDWNTTKKVPTQPGEKAEDGLLVRGRGGYVIAPPSWHASGVRYTWAKDVPLAPLPDWMKQWLQDAENKGVTNKSAPLMLPENLPDYLRKNNTEQGVIGKRASAALSRAQQTPEEIRRLVSALGAIPASCGRDEWLQVGFALHSLQWERPDGSDLGFEIWDTWSASAPDKYSPHDCETVWRSFGKQDRGGITLGTLFHLAEQRGWVGNAPRAAYPEQEVMPHHTSPPGQHNALSHSLTEPAGGAPYKNGHAALDLLPDAFTHPVDDSPLIELNRKYSAIGDVGGKCLVLGWVPSKFDETIHIPSFQSFKAFQERYANRYVVINKKKGNGWEEDSAQLGSYWLKWKARQSFDGIDLVPNGAGLLPGNVLNLWRGFAVEPKPGDWERMKAHIAEIIAEGDATQMEYIMKWSAWAVQHPGEQAEVAMVFRGDKGAGKGTFAHALRRLFGQHGLSIANSKHLVGAFNAHLRNCLLLYADEAFWAGDKQGESTLKTLITEPVVMIEQKGVDAMQWRNRIHLIMTANAEWVVPASHDERRYAIFNVSNRRMKDEKYFASLHADMANGGLSAMLHDLLHLDLGDWHPRRIPNTKALREQKARSMSLLDSWWESILQEGCVPAAGKDALDTAPAQYLMNHVRDFAPRLRDLTPTALGRFLADRGCIKLHKTSGNAWRFPTLPEARSKWESHYQGWDWDHGIEGWRLRS